MFVKIFLDTFFNVCSLPEVNGLNVSHVEIPHWPGVSGSQGALPGRHGLTGSHVELHDQGQVVHWSTI